MSETKPWLEMLRWNAVEPLATDIAYHRFQLVQQWLSCHVDVEAASDPHLRQLIEYLERYR